MLPEQGEVLTVEVHRISNNGNGIHEIDSDYSINLGQMKEQAIGKEITVKMVNKKFARPVRHLESSIEVGSEVTARIESRTSEGVPVMVSDGVSIEVADDSVELGEKHTVTIVEMWEGIDGLHAEGTLNENATGHSEDDDVTTQTPLNKDQSSPTITSSKEKVPSTAGAEKAVDTEEAEANPPTDGSPARLSTDETIDARERMVEQRIRQGQNVFRRAVRTRYADTCVLCGISEPTLLEAAHICSWSDHQTDRGDPANGLLLCSTHHQAFDRGLFTFTTEYELVVNPNFNPNSRFLKRTILAKANETLDFPNDPPNPEYIANHNEFALNWWPQDD